MHPLVSLILRVLLCCGATWIVFRRIGLIALPLCSVLFGVALARPVLELLGRVPRLARYAVYRAFHGRYFEYKGRQIVVNEDAGGHRWVALDAVRRVVPSLSPDRRLARRFPRAFVAPTQASGALLRAEELLEVLRGHAEPEAVRFKQWVLEELVAPAALKRSRSRAQAGQRVWHDSRDG